MRCKVTYGITCCCFEDTVAFPSDYLIAGSLTSPEKKKKHKQTKTTIILKGQRPKDSGPDMIEIIVIFI